MTKTIDEILNAVFTKGFNDNPNGKGGRLLIPNILMGKELTAEQAKSELLQALIEVAPAKKIDKGELLGPQQRIKDMEARAFNQTIDTYKENIERLFK